MANWYIAYTDGDDQPCSLAVFNQETIEGALTEAIRALDSSKPNYRITMIELVEIDEDATEVNPWFPERSQAH